MSPKTCPEANCKAVCMEQNTCNACQLLAFSVSTCIVLPPKYVCPINDLFFIPGLTQLVGMRYGAVPVVRKTGGLADTVRNREGTRVNL